MTCQDHFTKFCSERYRYEKLLGEGASGRAMLVSCRQDNTQWVVKEIDVKGMLLDEVQNCLKEAKLLEALNHPNIIKFREIYLTKEQKLHIVMEYADSGTLASFIKEAQKSRSIVDQRLISSYFGQLSLAVRHLHSLKIVHRDIKPQNVFITSEGFVKLGDFGVAVVLEKTQAKLNAMIGTPYYLAPEVVEQRPYSLPADIWSLGVILYEMMALKKPFTGGSLEMLALKIARGVYPEAPNNYGYGLRGLLKKMLVVDPTHRITIEKVLKLKEFAYVIRNHSQHGEDDITHSMLLNKVGRDGLEQQAIQQVVAAQPTPKLACEKERVQQDASKRNKSRENTKGMIRRHSAHKQKFQQQCSPNIQDLGGLLQIEAPLRSKMYQKAQLPRLKASTNIIQIEEDFAGVDLTQSVRELIGVDDNKPKEKDPSKDDIGNLRGIVAHNRQSVDKVRKGMVNLSYPEKLATNKIQHKSINTSKPKDIQKKAVGLSKPSNLLKLNQALLQTHHTLLSNSIRFQSSGISKLHEQAQNLYVTDGSFEEVPIEESIPFSETLPSFSKPASQPLKFSFFELEKLKMTFEQTFGVDNFIRLYKHLEELHSTGQEISQQEAIASLVDHCPETNRSLLSHHYGLLVTLLSCENTGW